MNKVLSFVRLDFITIKSYLKYTYIFFVLVLIMPTFNGNAFMAIIFVMALATVYISYPFLIGEKSNLDALYATLSIKRSTVVSGRYLFALVLDISVGLLVFILSSVVLIVMQEEFSVIASLSVVLISFYVFSFIQAFQLPIYFRSSYAKAKIIGALPLFIFLLVVMAGAFIMLDTFSAEEIEALFDWLAANTLVVAIVAAAIWLAVMGVSYKISLLFYEKRDF